MVYLQRCLLLTWLVPPETAAISARSVYIMIPRSKHLSIPAPWVFYKLIMYYNTMAFYRTCPCTTELCSPLEHVCILGVNNQLFTTYPPFRTRTTEPWSSLEHVLPNFVYLHFFTMCNVFYRTCTTMCACTMCKILSLHDMHYNVCLHNV